MEDFLAKHIEGESEGGISVDGLRNTEHRLGSDFPIAEQKFKPPPPSIEEGDSNNKKDKDS